MQVKVLFLYPIELRQTAFGKAPKTLYPVDMIGPPGELVLAMLYAKMFFITKINQSVVAMPAIGMNHRRGIDMSANNRL